MKYYLIKTMETPTKENTNPTSRDNGGINLGGKNGLCITLDKDELIINNLYIMNFLKNHGFKRFKDAVKKMESDINWFNSYPEHLKFWDTEVSVIELTVENNTIINYQEA